jgi:hypothetical protein
VNNFSVLGLGAVGLAVLALGLDEANEWRRDMSEKAYTQTRAKFLREELSNAEPVFTLVLGDSISAMTWLDGVCGTTFNASVPGARIGDVASLAPYAIERTRPKVIVLEVGTNHFHTNPSFSDFKRQYAALVRSLPGRKILVGVPNSPAASSFVRSVANQIEAAYVEPATGKLTRGGTHPTPEGASVYRKRIERACASRVMPA